jgi:hypothetical protein
LVDVLLVVVAGQDQQLPARIFRQRTQKSVGETVLVHQDDVRPLVERLEPRDERLGRLSEGGPRQLEVAPDRLALRLQRVVVARHR